MTYVKNIFRKPLMMLPVLAAIGFMLTASLGSSITAEPQNVPPVLSKNYFVLSS